MLKKSNIENVLDFFFRNPTIKLSIRDISRRTGLSVPTVASIVKKLITKDLLLNEKIGPSLMIYANLESEEFRDLKKLYNLYSLIDLKKFLVRQYNHPKVIFVYGSYAKGEDLENSDLCVKDYLKNKSKTLFSDKWLNTLLIEKLGLERLYEEEIKHLSGGELQKINIVGALAKDAELILMDEPSAFIDVEDRLKIAEIIKDFAVRKEICAIIVDHDIQFIDYLADSLLVFEGESGKRGKVFGPFDKNDGINRILKSLDITYRKDEETNRARINKEGSQLDQIQ